MDAFSDLLSLKAIAYWYEKFHLAPSCNLKIQGKIYFPEEANNIVQQYKATFKADEIIPEEELNQAL
jgi:hypothetical protein